jgi:hypothetical protein
MSTFALVFFTIIVHVFSQTTFGQQHCNTVNCNDVCVTNITMPCGQCIPCHPSASIMCVSAVVQCHQPQNETIREALYHTENCQGSPYRVITPDLYNPSASYCYKWSDFWVHNLCPLSSDKDPEFFSYLDLSRFVPKLLKEEPQSFPYAPTAWSAIVEYKRFLALKKALPNLEISPSPLVDKVWHMHILDTRRYMKDCDYIFGSYMHHSPSFDLDEDERHEMAERFRTTLEAYEKVFGIPAPEDIWPRIPSKEQVTAGAQCFFPSCCAM